MRRPREEELLRRLMWFAGVLLRRRALTQVRPHSALLTKPPQNDPVKLAACKTLANNLR